MLRHALPFALVLAPASAGPTTGAADCSLTTIGVTPLCDLGAGTYTGGHIGGLYPGGTSIRPAAHEALGLSIVQNHVVPRDASGAIDLAAGRVVMISIGMSNTTQQFSEFATRMNADGSTDDQLVIVDGAQGGQPAASWANPNGQVWANVDQRLANAGVTPEQVQVAWIKQAEAGPLNLGVFPAHAQVLQDDLEDIARNMRMHYPNLRIAYYSSRTRAYTDVPNALNPEPFAYESGFSVRWMIENQIAGDPDLDPDPVTGNAPWISWGPYLWTDGLVPRSDGFTWECSDLTGDFTHPSQGGREKVAAQLAAFFKTDVTTRSWFLEDSVAGTPPSVTPTADVTAGEAPLSVQFLSNASDADGTVDEIAWTFDDGTFSFASNPVKEFTTAGVHEVQVTATDDSGNPTSATITITVGDGPPVAPTITGPASPLDDATDGEAFAVSMTATGTQPIDWTVLAGTLPPGMTFSTSGLYSGTPTAVGTFQFTVEASNDVGSDTADFEHTVLEHVGPQILSPVADATVRDGSQAGANFGTETDLRVRGVSAGNGNAQAYMRFDLSALDGPCTSATLTVFLQNMNGTGLPVQAVAVADDGWVETSVTWNNKPATGAVIDAQTFNATMQAYSFDLTAYVAQEAAGDGLASLALVDATGANVMGQIRSRESGDGPLLEVTCDGAGDPTVAFCFCDAGAPCGNSDSAAGCASSSGSGALLAGSGSTSVAADDLFLSATNVPTNQFGIVYMGPEAIEAPFGDGERCVGPGATGVFRFPVQSSGAAGTLTEGPIVGFSQASFPANGQIVAGSTWLFQAWFRDPGGPCGANFNLSNGVSASFAP